MARKRAAMAATSRQVQRPGLTYHALKHGCAPTDPPVMSSRLSTLPEAPFTSRGSPMSELQEIPDNALDKFHHMMGARPDGEIASLAGVQRNTVMAYRRRLGIQAYIGHRFKSTEDADETLQVDAMPETRGIPLLLFERLPDAPVEPRAAAPKAPVHITQDTRQVVPTQVVVPTPPAIVVEKPVVEKPVVEKKPVSTKRVPITVYPGLAYTLTVAIDEAQQEYTLVGTNIVEALRRAVATLDARGVSYRLVSVRYVAKAFLR